MVISDNLLLVFSARGAGSVISAHATLADAQQRVAQAQQQIAATNPLNGGQYMAAWGSYQSSLTGLSRALAAEATQSATSAALLFDVMDKTVRRYTEFGNEIMNVRSLTGASSRDSVAAVMMAKAAGMNDTTEIRELMRSGGAVFSGKGQAALARLGIPANSNQSGLAIINQVSDRLQQMPDGLRKTQIMEDIFGQRGVAAMLPLLRLTKEQREEIQGLSQTFNTDGLSAIQQYQASTAILGQTFEQRVIFPLAEKLLPVFNRLSIWLTAFFNNWDQFAGPLGKDIILWGVAMVGFGAAVAGVVRAINYLSTAYKILAATEAFKGLIEGDVTMMAKVAGGAAVAAAVVYGIDNLMSQNSGGSNSPQNQMNKAADKMLNAATRMGDAVDQLKGKGIPGGLSNPDINAIWQQGAAHAIG